MGNKVHLSPRISATKLGDYLVSPPLRRLALLERLKYPCLMFEAYYAPSRSDLTEFICGSLDRLGLFRRAEKLVEGPHESSYAQHRAYNCAEAVLRFLGLGPLNLQGLNPSVAEPRTLDVEGVEVNIQPDIMLEGKGAITLHLLKTHPHSEASARYVTTLLRRYLEAQRGKTCVDACMVVDVFAHQIHTAPRNYKRCWRDIEAACIEIRRTWPTL